MIDIIVRQFNEAIIAATVIVAASLLLYNLTHNLQDRVTRSSSVLLGCVTIAFIGKVFVSSVEPTDVVRLNTWLRMQWIGIAFAPAALFHLSDALLATTGVISRGRRRRVVRILYLYGAVFLLIAAGTDLLIHDVVPGPIPVMQPGPLIGLYFIYFLASTITAIRNVLRARQRCLTKATRRRMTYLLLVFPTPALGIFPYSLLFPKPTGENVIWLWLLLNLGNIGIILMLAFMAYPLSFFGSAKADRVIKAELLRFMLRGPVLAVMVLLVILFVPTTQLLGLPGPQFMPFAAVGTVLFLQWVITLGVPILERRLIYTGDQEQAQEIREFSERLLTPADARQLLEASLAAICDYLRVSSAFIVSLRADGAHLEQAVGKLLPTQGWLDSPEFLGIADGKVTDMPTYGDIIVWKSYWLLPLYGTPMNGNSDDNRQALGIMGVWARSPQPDLDPEEDAVFKTLVIRVARVLEDMRLQEEIFATLEDIVHQTERLRAAESSRFRPAAAVATAMQNTQQIIDSPDFVDLIRDALRDLWGGPRLTEPRLLQLIVVKQALPENEGNPARAIRAVLMKAIESLKPDQNQRSLTTAEWALYNILDLRFVQNKKVRDVAMRLSMSEPDLYRKQKFAIEQVAKAIDDMERGASNAPG